MIRHTGLLTTTAEIASILKNIWGDRAEIEVSLTTNTNFIFTDKIIFKPNCRKTFPAKYKMNQITELTLQYAPNCKIYHRHNYTLPKCPFKSISLVWNISLGEPSSIKKQTEVSSNTIGMMVLCQWESC